MKNDEYNEREGKAGEDKAVELLKEALQNVDFPYYIIQNAILPYDSIYEPASAEFDIILFTPYLIFLFEVKNAVFSDHKYNENHWILDRNKEEISNPLFQNNVHKCVFCSEMNVRKEDVITVEVLLKNGKEIGEISPYVNDYVFDQEDMEKKLKYLIATKQSQIIDYETIYLRFKDKILNGESELEKHKKRLDRIVKIETRIKNVVGYYKFHRTDMVLCPKCRREFLHFCEASYHSTSESRRNSRHYMLGCRSYRGKDGGCKFLIYVDKYKSSEEFKKLERISIEKRNGWKPEEFMVKTLLEEFEELHSQIESEKAFNQSLLEERLEYIQEIENLKLEAKDYRERIKELEQNNNILKEKNSGFKKIIGRVYLFWTKTTTERGK